MDKKKTWFYTATGAIILSLASLFLPIITYRSKETGLLSKYNIFGLFRTNMLIDTVFKEYRGSFLQEMKDSTVSIMVVLLCLLGIAAIVLAFVGINSMSKQYESTTPFFLAIGGLIGTAVPSIVLLTLYLFSKNQYEGTMHLGAYILVTPIAMVIACLAVTAKHRLSREAARMQTEARTYIRPAGDLPVVPKAGGSQYEQ